eukprot:scaffold18055_cov63-Attheya_sp.AAC.1
MYVPVPRTTDYRFCYWEGGLGAPARTGGTECYARLPDEVMIFARLKMSWYTIYVRAIVVPLFYMYCTA